MNPTAAPAAVRHKEAHIPELATEEAIEIGPDLGPVECTFEEGDNVVYPHHGAGVVLMKETRDLLGEKRDYLTIKMSDVLVSSYKEAGETTERDSVPMDSVAINFSKIEIEFKRQNPDGSLATPVQAGWDLKSNQKA